MIWLGGSTFSNNPPFPDPSQAPLNFTMSELFRTQVQESGSPSSYMASGEPGVSSQDGRPSMVNATFNGRRLSASNALSAHSARSPVSNDISPYTVTTKESLKGGGTAAVETPPSTTYSSESMLSALTMNSFHTQYVASKANPADAPSRGIYPSTSLLLPPITLPSYLDRFLIDSQLPYTPTEQRMRREGRYPAAITKCIDDSNERAQANIRFHTRCVQESVPYWPIWDD